MPDIKATIPMTVEELQNPDEETFLRELSERYNRAHMLYLVGLKRDLFGDGPWRSFRRSIRPEEDIL